MEESFSLSFFMALKPCIDGFKAGCRPYLSIDSSFLTGKLNGLQCFGWTQLDVTCCYWLISVRDRDLVDMVHDAVEKIHRASVTFGSPHRCMQRARKRSEECFPPL